MLTSLFSINITSENTISPNVRINGNFRVIIIGTWSGIITLQKEVTPDWYDVDNFTTNVNKKYNSDGVYRLICKSGNYVSGTAVCSLNLINHNEHDTDYNDIIDVNKLGLDSITGDIQLGDENAVWTVPGKIIISNVDISDAPKHKSLNNIDILDLNLSPYSIQNLLSIPGPYTPDHVVHPSVLFSQNGWNGYKYWLAFTPLTDGDSDYENPCIVASNDGTTWEVPDGLTNPIVDKPDGGYNSDTNIAWNPDKSKIYMMFRERLADTANRLKVTESSDGITWTAPEIIKSGTYEVQDYGSPSFWFNGTNWVCITHNLDDAGLPVQIITTADDDIYGEWSDPSDLTITHPADSTWWHSFFTEISSGNILGIIQDGTGGSGYLYWALSQDNGETWTVKKALSGSDYYRCTFAIAETGANYDLYVVLGRTGNVFAFYRGWATLNLKETTVINNNMRSALVQAATIGLSDLPLFVDLFNRENDATGLGAATDGTAWTKDTGNTNVLGISSNMAYNVTTSVCRAIIDLGVSDYGCEVKFSTIGGQGWLVFRYVDSTHFWRVGRGSGVLKVEKVGGSWSELVSQFVSGDRIKVECVGNLVCIYLNGHIIRRYIDSTFATGTKIGLQASSTPSTYFDELIVWRMP